MKKRRLVYFTVAAFALVCAGQVFGPASVATAQSDYPPSSAATINGSGFQPGETWTCKCCALMSPSGWKLWPGTC